jgi:hypothetical protein
MSSGVLSVGRIELAQALAHQVAPLNLNELPSKVSEPSCLNEIPNGVDIPTRSPRLYRRDRASGGGCTGGSARRGQTFAALAAGAAELSGAPLSHACARKLCGT